MSNDNAILNKNTINPLRYYLTNAWRSSGEADSFLKSAVLAMVLRGMSAALTYLMFVLLARWTSQEEYGYFASAMSLALFLSVVSAVGQPGLLLRYVGQYLGRGTEELAKAVAVRGLLVSLKVSVLTGLGLIGFVAAAHAANVIDRVDYLVAAAFLVMPLAIVEVTACIARAFGTVMLAIAPRDIVWRLSVPLIAAAFMGAGFELSAPLILLIAAGSLFLISGAQIGILWRRVPKTRHGSLSKHVVMEWRTARQGFWAIAVVRNMTDNLGVVIVGLTLGPAAAATFFAAMKLSQLILLPMQGIQLISPPLISRHYWSNQSQKVVSVCRWSVAAITVPTLVTLAVIVMFGHEILSLFGETYRSGYTALIIIASGAVVHNLSGLSTHVLTMTGNEGLYLKIMLAASVPGLALLTMLALLYGANGAAAAYLLIRIGTSAVPALWARRKLNLDPSIFSLLKCQRSPA